MIPARWRSDGPSDVIQCWSSAGRQIVGSVESIANDWGESEIGDAVVLGEVGLAVAEWSVESCFDLLDGWKTD